MKMQEKGWRRVGGAAARFAGYILTGLAAVFLALLLSVLFAGTRASEDIGGAGVSEGDFLIVWKPAYLFSVPKEGDLVLFQQEETFSGEDPLGIAVYEETAMDMDQIRGKVVWKIPGFRAEGQTGR